MGGVDSIAFTFSFNPFLLIPIGILIFVYCFYIYKYTIPQVSLPFKTFLLAIRTIALVILLFLIFEPVLTIKNKELIKPVNLVLVDNSKSIVAKDSLKNAEQIKSVIEKIQSSSGNDVQFFTFGSELNALNEDSLSELSFTENITNYESLISKLGDTELNLASAIIISDGVITDGSNPVYSAEKLGLPIYTIGIGDTAAVNDIDIKKVLYNEYIYTEKSTTISMTISNTGFTNRRITAALFENNKVFEQKNLNLSNNGIDKVDFNYISTEPGEKKLMVRISAIKGESSVENNKKIFFVNVLDNKLKILIIAGSPSNDLSFIKNSLEQDENLSVSSITQISGKKFLEKNIKPAVIDSANILFLVGFPSQNAPSDLVNQVVYNIREKSKPFFLSLSDGLDYSRLKLIESELPFSIVKYSRSFNQIQPEITDFNNPLLQNNAPDHIEAWNNLPPVNRNSSEYTLKPESSLIAKIKVRNIPVNSPLIASRKIGRSRSIAVLAKDIWKWKLQTAERELNLFDSFIAGCVKWLNTSAEQKQVNIRTTKRLNTLGEPVEFIAQIYDATFNPLENAEVKIKIKNDLNELEVNLYSTGGGNYEGILEITSVGDSKFFGEAYVNNELVGKDNGKFSVGEIEIEFMSPGMNKNFLKLLANITGGHFYNIDNYDELLNELKENMRTSALEKYSVSELSLWSNEWILIIIIFMFGMEWFFRKRAGML